jgi:hypothetical protein
MSSASRLFISQYFTGTEHLALLGRQYFVVLVLAALKVYRVPSPRFMTLTCFSLVMIN